MEKVKTKILDFYKSRPGQCFGARKVDKALGFEDSQKREGWITHEVLMSLEKEGDLKRCNGRKGFKYNKAS